ncbi:MAG: hypothetical protein H7061_12670 [Bdellovibrionaceae bacterium]|nr:hypothetical protein [Bdellovibrio sp.]
MINVIKDVLLSFSASRSLYESMMKYDFKINESRKSIMQLCFSHLAAWPVVVGILLIMVNPFRHVSMVQKIFGTESAITFFLLDGHVSSMLIFSVLFFFAEWILRKEHLLTLIVFLFLVQGDLHIHLALASVIGIYFSRYCHQWWFHVGLESRTKNIWQTLSNIQLASWLVVTVAALVALDYLQVNQYFAASVSEYRLQFLLTTLLAYHALAFFMSALWGHFFVRQKVEPSDLPTYFSTANWILRFSMSGYLRKLLTDKTASALAHHQQAIANFKEIKDQSPGLEFGAINSTLVKEISFLEQASSRLTIE